MKDLASSKNTCILGIETSCDDTGVAIYSEQDGLLAHQLYSQVTLHQQYGGVVPELASRDHIRKLTPLIHKTMQLAKVSAKDISAIAYTQGPGLIGALLVGNAVAQSLSFAWQVPSISINHLEGHLLAPLLEPNAPQFPFVALLVSGGHTQLIEVQALGKYQLLGETLDDAAGEAFDKTAKLLGLPYPGGPHLAKLATQGNPQRFNFPRPMLDRPGLDFSFSGLKTFALNTFQKYGKTTQDKADIACAFELAVVETLVKKSQRAIKQIGLDTLVIAGGVGANQQLRSLMQQAMPKTKVFYPRHEFCTDNGAMIAFAGYLHYKQGTMQNNLQITPQARPNFLHQHSNH